MPFSYTPKTNTKISDIFNSLMPVQRTLPNGGGSYQAVTSAPVNGPVYSGPVQGPSPVASPTVSKPIFTPQPQPQASAPQQQPAPYQAPQGYVNPATGQYYTAQEIVDNMAKKLPISKTGDIPQYAGDSLTQGPQTTQQLTSTATDLNNARNDIATGTTDLYGIKNESGVTYSPTEMAAIEKAYAGIYDPVLKDVFAKLDTKQKEDAVALTQKNKLAEMAQQHKYDVELKKTAPGAAASTITTSGIYTPGENPTVDAWAERIYNGSAKITDIPASDKGMRNAVTVALQSYGNQANGKPTTTEIGLQTLDVAKRLKQMVDAGKGISMIGKSRLFGGGFATPGSDSANLENLFNTLQANKSLEGVKFLKGQGQVSDAERLLLKNAMSELNLTQSEDEFNKSLTRIIDKLEGNSVNSTGTDTGVNVTDPDGGVHSFPTQAAADEFKKAIGQ